VWQAFIKAYPELNTPLNHQAWQATLPLFASDAGRFDEARYQAFAHYMLDNKLIDQVAPLSRYSLPTQ
ncbi:MAG: thiamine biosynthesis protein, partial [Pantoea sp.]|nr:thiamine biosynthesis protein [Pantoea sp.]